MAAAKRDKVMKTITTSMIASICLSIVFISYDKAIPGRSIIPVVMRNSVTENKDQWLTIPMTPYKYSDLFLAVNIVGSKSGRKPNATHCLTNMDKAFALVAHQREI